MSPRSVAGSVCVEGGILVTDLNGYLQFYERGLMSRLELYDLVLCHATEEQLRSAADWVPLDSGERFAVWTVQMLESALLSDLERQRVDLLRVGLSARS